MKVFFSIIFVLLSVAAVKADDEEPPPQQNKLDLEMNYEALNTILSHPNFNSSGMYLPDVSFSFKFNRTNRAFINESRHFFNETEDGKMALNHRMVEQHLEKFLNQQLTRKQNQFVLDHYKNISATAMQNQTAKMMQKLEAMKKKEEKEMIEKMEKEDRQGPDFNLQQMIKDKVGVHFGAHFRIPVNMIRESNLFIFESFLEVNRELFRTLISTFRTRAFCSMTDICPTRKWCGQTSSGSSKSTTIRDRTNSSKR